MTLKRTKWDRKADRRAFMRHEMRRRAAQVLALAAQVELSEANRKRIVRGEMPIFDITSKKG